MNIVANDIFLFIVIVLSEITNDMYKQFKKNSRVETLAEIARIEWDIILFKYLFVEYVCNTMMYMSDMTLSTHPNHNQTNKRLLH